MKVLILGASGFVASNFSKYLKQRTDYKIFTASSKNDPLYDFYYNLGDEPNYGINFDCVLHFSYDFTNKESSNVIKTMKTIMHFKKIGIKNQIFISSYSAHNYAKSIYGQNKFNIEKKIKAIKDCNSIKIVRPGLVIGDGGLYKKISHWVKSYKFLVLPYVKERNIPFISINDLNYHLHKIMIQKRPTNEENIFYSKKMTLEEIVKLHYKSNFICLYLPAIFFKILFRFINLLKIDSPFSINNILGFISNAKSPHKTTIDEQKH